jgi:hypothetical protein
LAGKTLPSWRNGNANAEDHSATGMSGCHTGVKDVVASIVQLFQLRHEGDFEAAEPRAGGRWPGAHNGCRTAGESGRSSNSF